MSVLSLPLQYVNVPMFNYIEQNNDYAVMSYIMAQGCKLGHFFRCESNRCVSKNVKLEIENRCVNPKFASLIKDCDLGEDEDGTMEKCEIMDTDIAGCCRHLLVNGHEYERMNGVYNNHNYYHPVDGDTARVIFKTRNTWYIRYSCFTESGI